MVRRARRGLKLVLPDITPPRRTEKEEKLFSIIDLCVWVKKSSGVDYNFTKLCTVFGVVKLIFGEV
jgi:hypothetical protein